MSPTFGVQFISPGVFCNVLANQVRPSQAEQECSRAEQQATDA
jgi:hypothetical protein